MKTTRTNRRRAISRRSRTGSFRTGLETLEHRQLLACDAFEAFPADEIFGNGGALDQLQSVIDQATFASQQIPLIGDQLSGSFPFGVDMRQALTDAYQEATGDLQQRLSETLTSVLGESNLQWLDQAVDVEFDADACVVTATVDLSRTFAEWNSPNLNFDVGLRSLPFYVTSDVGSLEVEVGFDMTPFSISIDGNTGAVSLDTEGTTLSVEVVAELEEGANLSAQVGFLHMHITDGVGDDPQNNRSRVEAGFALTLGDGGQLENVSVQGTADLRLQMQSEVNEYLPSVSADFLLHYDLTTNEAPEVGFENVSIELGDVVSKVLGPIVEVVEPLMKPLDFVMDLLSEPIPVISDLGLGEYSVLDIANGLADHGALPPDITAYVKMADLVERVSYFVSLLENADCGADDCGGVRLNFGEFSLSDINGDLRGLDPKLLEPTLTDVSLSHLAIGNVGDLSGLAERLEGLNLPDIVKSGLLDGLDQIQDQLDNGISIDFPIIDNPASVVFQWLIGQNADLFRVDAGVTLDPVDVDLSGPMPIGIDGGLRGGIQPSAHLGLGYDTFGLRRFLDNLRNDTGPQGADFLDGFYITGDSELRASGFLEAYLALNALVFSIEATGGIYASLSAEIIDSSEDPSLPNVDNDHHRVRFYSEMDACSFHLAGDIHAAISLIAKLGVQLGPIFAGIQHRWDLADFQLAGFDLACIGNPLHEPESVALGELSDDGTLTLFVGATANQRSVDPAEIHERFVLSADSGLQGDGAQTIRVQAFGVAQVFDGVKQIVASFGNGNDTLTLGDGIAISATIEGGSGNDVLRSNGQGEVHFFGNDGDDELRGGQGSNELHGHEGRDVLFGGGLAGSLNVLDGGLGSDILLGGVGHNQLHGGIGDDQLTAGPNGNEMYGEQGHDQFVVGEGHSSIFGGSGDDQVLWTHGNGTVDFDGGAGWDTMGMVGSSGVDRFTLFQHNGGVRVVAPGTDAPVWTQNSNVENLSVDARDGADQILVQSLTGSPIERVSLNLSDQLDEDGSVDVITIRSRMERDDLLVEKLDSTLTELPAHEANSRGGVMRFSGFRSHPLTVDDSYEILAMNFGDRITLNSRSGDDRITVKGITGPTFIETDRGDDEVIVQASRPELFGNGAGDYLSELSVDAGHGKNRLVVSEQLSQIEDVLNVTASRISSRLLPAVHYDASRGGTFGGGIRIEAGPHDDRIEVTSTRGDAVTEIHGGAGAEQIVVSSRQEQGHLNFIGGKLLLDGGTGPAKIVLSDMADATPSPQVTVDPTTAGLQSAVLISGLAGRHDETSVVVVDRPQTDLTIETSQRATVAERFVINTTNLGSLAIYDHQGDAQYMVEQTRGNLRIFGESGDEQVHVTPKSRFLGNLGGTLAVEAGAGNDQLMLYDTATSEVMSYELAEKTLSRFFGAQTVAFDTGLESLSLWSAQVADTLNVVQLPISTNIVVDQGNGNDAIVGPATGGDWVIDGADRGQLQKRLRFQSSETLASSGGSHRFSIVDGGSISNAIVGSVSGIDTLDYSQFSGPVTIDVAQMNATNVASFKNLDAFIGGRSVDSITGPNAIVDWNLTGRGVGTFQPSGGAVRSFHSIERIFGGTNADRFAIGTSSNANLVSGGAGIDELNYASFMTGVEVDLAVGTATRLSQISQIENVRGGAGDDELRGDAADNQLWGQAGNDLLLGRGGNDTIRGGGGRDAVLGGTEADSLFGDEDSDLLIAGTTSYDHQATSLRAIRDEWMRLDQNYSQRIQHLRQGNGLNAPHVLNTRTVLQDAHVDQLFGGSDQDWFWADNGDVLAGAEPNEQVR